MPARLPPLKHRAFRGGHCIFPPWPPRGGSCIFPPWPPRGGSCVLPGIVWYLAVGSLAILWTPGGALVAIPGEDEKAPPGEDLALLHREAAAGGGGGGAALAGGAGGAALAGGAGAAEAARGLEPGRNPVARRGHTSQSLPWVHATEVGKPDALGEDLFETPDIQLSPWALFEEKLDTSRTPGNVPAYFELNSLPLFYLPPPNETELARKLKRLVQKKAYREFRSRVRRYWKSQFREHPSLTYADYEKRLIQINHIGKDPVEYDTFNVEYTTNEVKQDLFRRQARDGEADIPVVTWGPFTLTDSAKMKFDLGTAAHASEDDARLELGDERKKPLIGNKNYRVDTSFNFDIDPLRAYHHGDATYVVRGYGVTVEVDWLTDVLSRETISTEIECEADLQGEFAVFANFVIKSR